MPQVHTGRAAPSGSLPWCVPVGAELIRRALITVNVAVFADHSPE